MESEAKVPPISKKDSIKKIACNLPAGFKEPDQTKDIVNFVIAINADEVKDLIAIDRGIDAKDITIFKSFEKLSYAIYIVCIDGYKYRYRRKGKKLTREDLTE